MVGRRWLGRDVEREFWAGIRSGLTIAEAARAAGAGEDWGRRVYRDAGGVNPMPCSPPRGRYLQFREREEILVLRAAGHGVREIARRLGRSPSTVSRELARGSGRDGYRASRGQQAADRSRRGPRPTRMGTCPRLRVEVQARLERRDSPEQIAGRLRLEFPDDPEMHVCHETIYRALYVQGRGELRRELARYLRTGRWMRKTRRREGERRGRISDMVMISERPPEVEDRAVPGHWEGDLIIGAEASRSAVGTLVERASGFTLLVHLPDGRGALTVQEALVDKILTLPEQLRLSLTWDQGGEMHRHKAISEATGMDIYFCPPSTPWLRGSNENTNGLLRQYLPKGTDLSVHTPEELDAIAAELNSRPRKRHGYRTPAEVLDQLLSEAAENAGVA